MIITTLASGSKGNAYYVSNGITSILIECGLSYRELQQRTGFTLSGVSGVLVSHCHNDHCKAVKDCIRYGLDVYAPKNVFDVKKVSGRRCIVVKPFKWVEIDSFSVLPFDCEHDCVNYGYLVCSKATNERLLYFTDTCMVKYRFDGLTHIMAECNYSLPLVEKSVANGYIPESLKERLTVSHMSIDNLLKFLRVNDLSAVQDIYLLHLSENNSHADDFKNAVVNATGRTVVVCSECRGQRA